MLLRGPVKDGDRLHDKEATKRQPRLLVHCDRFANLYPITLEAHLIADGSLGT